MVFGIREVYFKVGDRVLITTKNWQIGRPSRKVTDLSNGPYEIIEQVGHAYRLNLPENLKVHPVFNPSKLRLATKTAPLTGQTEDPPLGEVIKDSQEWEVEEILASRLHYRKLQYRIKWVGYDEDSAWYPASNSKNAPQKLIEFHDAYPDRPGPPMRLSEWTKAALEDEYLEDHENDNKAATV
ncbi:Retrovirus polyprotein [Penicillium nucicola]|uniref:Retrovirus polyprotein n=1 Tax=Penicillium nucicola TaxID=1850975 RepID=UPI002544FBCD|nr:Retrovirus polyprotein [Penicillium nucicola]KAJ5753565.1 Retrovirus polyprotein [Penicillium nucicola]